MPPSSLSNNLSVSSYILSRPVSFSRYPSCPSASFNISQPFERYSSATMLEHAVHLLNDDPVMFVELKVESWPRIWCGRIPRHVGGSLALEEGVV